VCCMRTCTLQLCVCVVGSVPCFMVPLPTQKASAGRACRCVGAHAASTEGSPCSCSCCIQVASSAPKPRELLLGRLVSPAWYRATNAASGCRLLRHATHACVMNISGNDHPGAAVGVLWIQLPGWRCCRWKQQLWEQVCCGCGRAGACFDTGVVLCSGAQPLLLPGTWSGVLQSMQDVDWNQSTHMSSACLHSCVCMLLGAKW
jgi:hypothetical protein